jgi:hypothetical protein
MRYIFAATLVLLAFAVPSGAQQGSKTMLPYATEAAFAEGVAASKDGKVFVVVITNYDEESIARPVWQDADVQAWLSEHGTGLWASFGSWDQKGPPAPETQKTLSPGVTAFRDGKAFDHDDHFGNAKEALEWLEFVAKGEIPEEYIKRRAGTRDTGSLPARLAFAERLDRLGRKPEADVEYGWALEQWLRMDGYAQPNPGGVRPRAVLWDPVTLFNQNYPFMKRGTEFAERDPEAHQRLASVRNELAEKAKTPECQAATHWLVASSIAPDAQQMKEVADRWMANPDFRRSAKAMRMACFVVLTEKGEWKAAAGLIDKPIGWVGEAFVRLSMMEGMADGRTSQKPGNDFMGKEYARAAKLSASIYAALLAAGRENEADLVAQTVFQMWDMGAARAAFVEAALKAYQPRSSQVEWAKMADADPDRSGSPPLLPLLDKALVERPQSK